MAYLRARLTACPRGSVLAFSVRGATADTLVTAAMRPAGGGDTTWPPIHERRAWADAPAYALVVGFNGSPPGAAGDVPPPLRFADDDALAFYQLRRQLGDHAVVLTASDDDTRHR